MDAPLIRFFFIHFSLIRLEGKLCATTTPCTLIGCSSSKKEQADHPPKAQSVEPSSFSTFWCVSAVPIRLPPQPPQLEQPDLVVADQSVDGCELRNKQLTQNLTRAPLFLTSSVKLWLQEDDPTVSLRYRPVNGAG